MRFILILFAASVLLIGLLSTVGSTSPFTGPAGPCPNCTATAAPTSGPSNNQPCTYIPPSTIPFYQALIQPGLTQKGNNTCIPYHEYTEVEFDSSFCTVACNNSATPSPTMTCPPGVVTQGLCNMDLYGDFFEDGTSFSSGPSNNACEANYPYNVGGPTAPPFIFPAGLGPPNYGACKPMKYVNPNILHANEQIAFVGGSPIGAGLQACNKPGTGIKFYGTPGNPSNQYVANPPGMLGDTGGGDGDIEHDGIGTTRAHDIYFTDQNSCKFTGAAPTPTPAPVQNYLAYLGSSHLQHWMASLESGATVSSVCAYTACGGPSSAGAFADNEFMYENDQSATSIVNQTNNTGASSQPTNPPSSQTTTQHWANDQAMVNDRVTLFNSETHQLGTTCETLNTVGCIATGTGIAQQFNGLTNSATTANACYLYTNALTGNYASTNVLQGEFEMPVAAFNGREVEPRGWRFVLNCASDILANTNGQLFFNDHQTLDTTYKFYYDVFALKMLTYSNGRISSEVRLDDGAGGNGCTSQCNVNLTTYPLQQIVPDPTANGSPAMAKFTPPPSVHSRDANGYDSTAMSDGVNGSGCDQFDQASDHGATDLLAATLSHTFGTAGCTGAGFSTYGGVTGCSNLGYAIDWKCNPAAVWVREFANVYYLGMPITTAPISSAANYMAVVLNSTALTYQVQCSDLPLEGGANYGHVVTATPATPTQNAMDMVNGGSLAATTTFACGTASANLAPESAFVLVK